MESPPYRRVISKKQQSAPRSCTAQKPFGQDKRYGRAFPEDRWHEQGHAGVLPSTPVAFLSIEGGSMPARTGKRA